jgi:hypothetical protein
MLFLCDLKVTLHIGTKNVGGSGSVSSSGGSGGGWGSGKLEDAAAAEWNDCWSNTTINRQKPNMNGERETDVKE